MTAATLTRPAGYVMPPELVARAHAEAAAAPALSDRQRDRVAAILTGGNRR